MEAKRRLKLNGLHGVISQKMMLFITTVVKTSNPTMYNLINKGYRVFYGNEFRKE
jgi:hypothetical protein